MEVAIKKLSALAKMPVRGSELSAGSDLCAALVESVVLEPSKRMLISTGLAISLPAGFEAQIRPRSGLALKKGITVLNTPVTIDADYRGELKVILVNLGEEPFLIEPGMRIAQMVIARHETPKFVLCDQLPDSQRSNDGFGSTGLK